MSILFRIDSIKKEKNTFFICGWAVSKNGARVSIDIDNARLLYTIDWIKRQDVQRNICVDFEYPFDEGFVIKINKPKSREIELIFSDNENSLKRRIIFNFSFLDGLNKKLKISTSILKKVGNIFIEFSRYFSKTLLFLRFYGLKKTYQKVIVKINNYFKGDLENWFKRNYPSNKELNFQREYCFEKKILISIVVPVYQTSPSLLSDMLDSVINQTYKHWELCIVDGGNSPDTKKILDSYSKNDSRINVEYLTENKGIAGNSNAAIAMATGDYVGLLDHDDTLMPNCLFECVKSIHEHEYKVDFLYTDEYSTFANNGKIRTVHCKPDFSPDTLISCNYICHFLLVKTKLLQSIGGFRTGFDGSQDHDLVLRLSTVAKNIVHIPKVLYNWKTVNSSLSNQNIDKCIASSIKAIEDHLKDLHLTGNVIAPIGKFSRYKVNYDILQKSLVSIIIPNKDHIQDLKKCVNSILKQSTYQNFEIIIVENNSTEKKIFTYYEELKNNSQIRIVTHKQKGFNFSAICNDGASMAKGEYLLFLNNDTEVITPNWIEELLMYAQREDVGVVGCKLFYPDNTIQHAGVVIGAGGVAGVVIPHIDYRNDFVCNYSAVTGACVIVKKTLFETVGGFDETLFKVAYNDIDLCLKIRALGKLVVYTPFAQLYHYESKSRGIDSVNDARFRQEMQDFVSKWIPEGYQDPYYNPNLSLEHNDFRLKE